MHYLIKSLPLRWEVSNAVLVLPVRKSRLGRDQYRWCPAAGLAGRLLTVLSWFSRVTTGLATTLQLKVGAAFSSKGPCPSLEVRQELLPATRWRRTGLESLQRSADCPFVCLGRREVTSSALAKRGVSERKEVSLGTGQARQTARKHQPQACAIDSRHPEVETMVPLSPPRWWSGPEERGSQRS